MFALPTRLTMLPTSTGEKLYSPPVDFGELQRLNSHLKGMYAQRVAPKHLQYMTSEVGWLLGLMYDQYLALKSFTSPGVEESVSAPMKDKLKQFLVDVLYVTTHYMPKATDSRSDHYVLCNKLAEEAAALGKMWEDKVAYHTKNQPPYPDSVSKEGYTKMQDKVNENKELEKLYKAQGEAVLLAWDSSLTFNTMRDTLSALKQNLKGIKYSKLTPSESVEVDAAIAHAKALENELIPAQQETLNIYLKTAREISIKVKNLERDLYTSELGKRLIHVASDADELNTNATLETFKAMSEVAGEDTFFTKAGNQKYLDDLTLENAEG